MRNRESTGFFDKEMTPIFLGDIVKTHCGNWSSGIRVKGGYIKEVKHVSNHRLNIRPTGNRGYVCRHLLVIGNTIDDPELISK